MTQSSFENPYPKWHPLHYAPKGAESILDVGCNVGEALLSAHRLGFSKFYGIDINPEAIRSARQRLAHLPCCELAQGSADELPFPDQSAEFAFTSEVLEHVPEDLRPGVIREVHRVLAKDGTWVITVPSNGLFSFLDPANVRFRLPALHRLANRAFRGQGREAGYQDQKHGVVWHHHFSLNELRDLFDPLFKIEQVRWRGCLLTPICNWLQFPFYRLKDYDSPVLQAINRIQWFEMSLQLGERLAYNVILALRRVAR